MTTSTSDGELLRDRIAGLRKLREQGKTESRRRRGRGPGEAARREILEKTGGRCHICGGEISDKWQADHVRPHSAGGTHSVDNYLPAHKTCNNYRWDYLPEEFQLILKLGVWARTQIEKDSPAGRNICEKFAQYEKRREARRKSGGG